MNWNIKVVTAPAVEPVSVADVKLHAHIDHNVEDAIISTWAMTARMEVENYTRQSLITQSLERICSDFPPSLFMLPRAPVQSVTSIKYTDSAAVVHTVDASTYVSSVDTMPARVALGYSETWPSATLQTLDAVKIAYVAGYGSTAASVPDWAKSAIYLYCTFMNENRAGEVEKMPRVFYDILHPYRQFLGIHLS